LKGKVNRYNPSHGCEETYYFNPSTGEVINGSSGINHDKDNVEFTTPEFKSGTTYGFHFDRKKQIIIIFR
jgi:hypothetical protein